MQYLKISQKNKVVQQISKATSSIRKNSGKIWKNRENLEMNWRINETTKQIKSNWWLINLGNSYDNISALGQ